MRLSAKLIVLLAAFCIIGGCSDDECPSCPEPPVDDYPIAQFSFEFSGGAAEQVESFRCALRYDTNTSTDSIATVILRDGDTGICRTFDAENSPNFSAFSEMMTNGSDDMIQLIGWRLPSELISGFGGAESSVFMGGLTGDMNPDLAGAQITGVMMTIQAVAIDIPGYDPNGDGNWTDWEFNINYMVFGVI